MKLPYGLIAAGGPVISWDTCPNQNLVHGMRMWIEYGVEPGEFLRAVLCSDLIGAVMMADRTNLSMLPDIVRWMMDNLPSPCWGSRDRYESWLSSTAGG